MATPRAVIFDLGGTLVRWSDWETGADGKWAASYDHLVTQFGLGVPVSGAELLGAMDGYAKAIAGWSTVDPEAASVLTLLRERGYRLGLLSNTWWAADWHNADLATHGLASLLDAIVYTSDLPHSKPHRSVFQEVARRLDVRPDECVMIGDRMVDDVSGALEVGMRAIWRKNESGFPSSIAVPTAEVTRLSELPELLQKWGGA